MGSWKKDDKFHYFLDSIPIYAVEYIELNVMLWQKFDCLDELLPQKKIKNISFILPKKKVLLIELWLKEGRVQEEPFT